MKIMAEKIEICFFNQTKYTKTSTKIKNWHHFIFNFYHHKIFRMSLRYQFFAQSNEWEQP